MREQDYTESVSFLTRFFGVHDGAVELRACPNVKGAPGAESLITRDSTELRSFCRRKHVDGIGVYFGACVRRKDADNGSAANVISCPALWVDIDCVKQGLVGSDVIAALEFLPHPPTIIVNSGGGLHAYWMLEEAVDLTADRDQVTQALRALAHILAGDMQCAEVARIMRLPGTLNSKAATKELYDGESAVCEILSDNGSVHDLDTICEWLSEQRAVLHGKIAAPKPLNESDPFVAYARAAGYEPAIDIDAALAAMTPGGTGDTSIHATQLRVSMSMIARGYEDDEIVDGLIAATERAQPAGEKWNWAAEEKAIRRMIASGRKLAERDQRPKPAPRPMTNGNAALAVVHDLDQEREKRAAPKAKKETGGRADEIVILGGATLAAWHERYGPIQHSNGLTYVYREGIWNEWSEVHDQVLRIMMQEGCERLGLPPKPALINASTTYFLNRPPMFVDDLVFDLGNLIVAGDGVLDLDTMEILPHSPDHQASYKIAANLNGSRECSAFLAFLREAFSDQPEDQIDDIIQAIREWFGTCLMRSRPRALMKGMLVWGASRTGKTQLSEILRNLLGTGSTVATSVADIGTDFGLQSLVSARAWIADDAVGQGETLDAERYKKLVTGEQIGARIKGLSDRQMRFGKPVMLTMNNLPRIKDGSLAVYNRSMMIKMTVVRPEDAPEPVGYNSLAAKVVAEELTGILWWAIQGWQTAIARGRFAEPECMLEAVRGLQRSNDAVRAWADDGVVEDPTSKVAKVDLFAAFAGWYFLENGAGKNPWSQNGFIKSLKNVFPSVGEQTAAVRYITGIRLTEEGVQHWSTDQERDLNRVATKTTEPVFLNQVFSASHSQRVKPVDLQDRTPRF